MSTRPSCMVRCCASICRSPNRKVSSAASAVSARERPVAFLVGDGGFLYNPVIQALGATKQHNLPILIVIFNNQGYMAMQKGHVHHYPDGAAENAKMHLGSKLNGPDYAELGSHFGLHGERVEQ